MKRIDHQQFLYLFVSFICNNSAEFEVLGWGAWRRTKRPSKSIINHRGTSSVGPGLQFTRELIMIENHRKATSISILLFPIGRLSIRSFDCGKSGWLMHQRFINIFWKQEGFLKRNAYENEGRENAELVNSSRIRANCSIHVTLRLTSTTSDSARLIILSLPCR